MACRDFQGTFGLGYYEQVFSLPCLIRDYVYHQEDNSFFFVTILRKKSSPQSSPKWLFPVPELGWLCSETIIKMIHFVLFHLRPLSACICRGELKALLALLPPYCKIGTVIQSGNCSCHWCFSKLCMISKIVEVDMQHHECFCTAMTSTFLYIALGMFACCVF